VFYAFADTLAEFLLARASTRPADGMIRGGGPSGADPHPFPAATPKNNPTAAPLGAPGQGRSS
jgi:hypothetical protein